MNANVLKRAGIDYDYCVKRFVGRANLFEKALGKFAKDTTIDRIRAAYGAKDMEGLLASAHEFKGMCGNIGLTSLYEAADALVALLRSGAYDNGTLDAAYRCLDETYDAVHGAVIASMEETV